MAKHPPAILDVALLLGLSGGPGRDILHGVSTAVRRIRAPWRLHPVVTHEWRRALDSGTGGIIAVDCPEAEELRDAPVPLVFIGRGASWLEGRKAPLAFATIDEESVGRTGAAYLESLGMFRSFGFAKTGDNAYSRLRASGFSAHLHRKGRAPRNVSQWNPPEGVSAECAVESLAEWLSTLPRPAAVMASCDDLAARVLDAASRARLRVPKDITLLGVDNDELICETAEPPIASIALDHERLGRLAVDALRRLLARPSSGPFSLVAPVRGVVERLSARPVAPATMLAERAAAFIERNAVKGIGAADVAAHLGVSRSLCDLRFRQVMGESPLERITNVRLEAVRRKLVETDLPVTQVARSCGFGDPSHAGRIFRRRFGVSMREFRAKR